MTRLVAYGENGRRVGESHHHATIPQAIVDEIRQLHEDHGWGYRRIAKHVGLAWYTVAKIAKYSDMTTTTGHHLYQKTKMQHQEIGFLQVVFQTRQFCWLRNGQDSFAPPPPARINPHS